MKHLLVITALLFTGCAEHHLLAECPDMSAMTVSAEHITGDCPDPDAMELSLIFAGTGEDDMCGVRMIFLDGADCSFDFETECDGSFEGDVWEWRGPMTLESDGTYTGIISRRAIIAGEMCAAEYRLTLE